MAQADNHRRFYGIIKRKKDDEGNSFVYGKIKVNDGVIYAQAQNQDELGTRLDKLVLMILDGNLHGDAGKTSIIAETPFFLN